MKEKILVAMSGGVDSSVAAWLMKEQGYDVVGVSMHLVSCHRPTERSCCSAEDRLDARRVCEALGIPYFTLDYRDAFQKKVIQPFVAAYARGRTPIPCVSCNSEFKFAALFDDMVLHEAVRVATGHYAKVLRDSDGRYRLYRGRDQKKDQTYFLFQLRQQELSKIEFPLAEVTKAEVRAMAKKQGFVTQDKPESQEICFVTDDDYAGFVESHGGHLLQGEGNFVDREGKVLGRHEGIHAYTIGQRRGLKKGFGQRMYVVEIRPETNEVVLGLKQEVMRSTMTVTSMHWTAEGATTFDPREYVETPLEIRIRSTHAPAVASIKSIRERIIEVAFDEPQMAIAPGQAAVFYQGDEVLGGGWIA